MKLLNVSGSPHVHSDESTKKIMWQVNLALVPALIVAVAFFGLNALLVSIISVASCVLFQWLIEKFILKTESTICDGSAVVTGLLLAFNMPSGIPLWPWQEPLQPRPCRTCFHAHLLPRADDHMAETGREPLLDGKRSHYRRHYWCYPSGSHQGEWCSGCWSGMGLFRRQHRWFAW